MLAGRFRLRNICNILLVTALYNGKRCEPVQPGYIGVRGYTPALYCPVVQEGLSDEQLEDEAVHPWRYAKDREDIGVPY